MYTLREGQNKPYPSKCIFLYKKNKKLKRRIKEKRNIISKYITQIQQNIEVVFYIVSKSKTHLLAILNQLSHQNFSQHIRLNNLQESHRPLYFESLI